MSTTYLREMTKEAFANGTLDLFWQFLCERQRMWVRRSTLNMSRPWTVDPVMDREFFTNVYRELDPATEYLIDDILLKNQAEEIDVVFNVMIFRLMGSQTETHRKLRFQKVESYDPERIKLRLKKVPMEDTKFFGDAYRVAGYHEYNGGSKVNNVAMLFKDLAEQLPELFEKMKGAGSVKELYDIFSEIKGFGEFLAQQVITDLLYLGDMSQPMFREFTTDEWAAAGPGARKGIWYLMRPEFKPLNMMMVMRWLTDHQIAEFERLELDFPFLADEDGEPVLLSISNIQTCLCEFSKYMRIIEGKKGVRIYYPSGSRVTERPTVLSEEQVAEIQELTLITTASPGHVERDEPIPEPNEPESTVPDLASGLIPFAGGLSLDQPRVVVLNPTGTLALPYAVLMIPLNASQARQHSASN